MIKVQTKVATVVSLFVLSFFTIVVNTHALNLQDAFKTENKSLPFGSLVKGANYDTAVTSPDIVAFIINAVLSFLGIIFIILVIYGGYTWMVARGDAQKVTKAKDTITEAVIGLIIVFAAYAISYFVTSSLVSPFMK